MFNFETVIPHHHHTSNTFITEKRAPTDDSVKLLVEFERAAKEKIVKAQELDNNVISAVVWHLNDYLSLKKKFNILIKLNGETITIEHSVDPILTNAQILESIYEKISERISATLMDSIVKDLRGSLHSD